MNYFKKAFYKVLYYLRIKDSISIARKMGVRIGDGCKVLDDPFNVFCTEPYLMEIGSNVELTHGVKLLTHDGSLWVLRNVFQDECKDIDLLGKITIGNNVFVGYNSIVLAGVTIGDNVIVGAGSVVTKDLRNGGVYAGTPAKYIRSLDKFKDKVLLRADYTKSLDIVAKEKAVRELHPEWF